MKKRPRLKHKIISHLLLSILFTGLTSPLFAKTFLPLENNFISIPLSQTDVFEDPSCSLSFQEITDANRAQKFSLASTTQNQIDNFNSNYWLKFTVDERSTSEKDVYIGTGDWSINYLDCYIKTKDTLIVFNTGLYRSFYSRDIKHKNFFFKVPSSNQPVEVYFCLKSSLI